MKKKQLTKIIRDNILMTLAGIFLFLMVITTIFAYLYVKSVTGDLIFFRIENMSSYAVFMEEGFQVDEIAWRQEEFDHDIQENGDSYIRTIEFTEFLKDIVRDNVAESEMNLVSTDGIIVASSVSGNVGFDMHSTELSEELLNKIEESDGIYVMPDFIESPMDGSTMRYSAVKLTAYEGFVLRGVTPEEYQIDKQWYLSGRIPFMRIGREGYYLLIDKNNEIIYSPENKHNGEKPDIDVNLKELAENGRIAKDTIYGVSSYIGALKDGDDLIVAVYPVSEAWEEWIASLIVLIAVYAIVFVVLFMLINRLTGKHVVKGVVSLDNSLAKITGGDLEEKADFRDSIEFDELSDGINYMVDRLKELIKEAEKRINDELAMAAEIQTSFLPREFPPFPDRDEFELYACMIPAKEVGGDFYDFFLIDDDHLALVIADVSGKGIPAAMFMAAAKNKIQSSVMKHGTDVAEAVKEVNIELCGENDEGLFVTVWVGVLTISTGHMDYVDAGHDYPAIYRAGGEFVIEKDVHCAMVGAMSFTEFKAGAFDLKAGDILYLYTDGITEAINASEEMFREERMIEALNKDTTASVEDIDSAVRSAVSDFVKDAPQFDDMTTLVFRYKG